MSWFIAVRHGEDDGIGGKLTPEGESKIIALAGSIEDISGAVMPKIISSPMLRAKQSANLIAEHFHTASTVNQSLMPGASRREYQELFRQIESEKGSIILVAHLPHVQTLISMAVFLYGGKEASQPDEKMLDIKKGQAVAVNRQNGAVAFIG